MWDKDEYYDSLNRPEPVKVPEHGKLIVESVKKILERTLYEDSDFEITDEYISIDLVYDSKSYVSFYQERITERYANSIRLDGTRVTVYFGEAT